MTEQAFSRLGVAWSQDGSSMVKLPYSSVVANKELSIVLGPSVAQVTATLLPVWEKKVEEYEIVGTWKGY